MTQQEIDRQKDATREHILDSARYVFGRYGYKKTTLEDVAKQAKKGKSSLYYYFSSKEEIFKAVVDLEASILGEQLVSKVAIIDDPRKKILAYVVERTKRMAELYSYYDAIKSSSLDELDFIFDMRAKYMEEEIEIFKKILESGVQSGLFAISNTFLVARSLAIALKGYELPIVQSMIDKNDFEPRIEEMINVLCQGILASDHR